MELVFYAACYKEKKVKLKQLRFLGEEAVDQLKLSSQDFIILVVDGPVNIFLTAFYHALVILFNGK